MDASGLHAFEIAVRKLRRDGVRILLTAVQSLPLRVMERAGLVDTIGKEKFCADLDEALTKVRKLLAPAEAATD